MGLTLDSGSRGPSVVALPWCDTGEELERSGTDGRRRPGSSLTRLLLESDSALARVLLLSLDRKGRLGSLGADANGNPTVGVGMGG